MKMTIRQKLISITLIIMLPLLAVSSYSYYMMVQATRHESSLHIRLIATDISRVFEDIFDKSFDIIETLATHPAVKNMDPAACDRLFAKLLPSYPLHLNILAARMDGFNAGSAISSANIHQLNYLDKEWFQRSSRGKRIVGNLHTSKLFKAPAIMIAGPVYGDDASQKGVIGFPLNLDSIRNKIVKDWQLPPRSSVIVVDGAGNILVDTLHKEHVGTNRSDMPVIKAARKVSNNFMEMTAGDAIERLYYVTTPAATDWRVIVGVPSSALNRNARQVNGRYLSAILFAAILGLSISFLTSRRITGNIYQIVKGIKAVGNSQLDYRLELRGDDELADIAGYFNTMAEQHQQYELKLKNAAEQWQTTFDAAHDIYLLFGRDYRVERVNQATTQFLGLPARDIIGRNYYELVYGTSEPPPGSPLPKMLASKEHEEAELWNEAKGIWMAVSVDPVHDEEGKLAQVVCIIRDITEHKRAEVALQEQFKQISAIFDGMGVIAHVVDPVSHELLYLNKYGASIFGTEWQGKPCHEILRCGSLHPCALTDEELHLPEGQANLQHSYVYKNSSNGRWYKCVETQMDWIDGRHVLITVASDVTDLKNIMQMQDDLISAVSHEMRTPLTAICGYTELLLECGVDKVNAHEFLNVIQKESKRLNDLLENFLNLQRLKASTSLENTAPLSLTPLLEEAAVIFAARTANHRITTDIPHYLPPVLISERHMNELLNNLLSNAIKYSPKGGEITLGATVDENDMVTFWVRDEGIGIAPDVKDKIFDRFYQVESGDRRTFSGIGLGLALVKEIVIACCGSVRVESEVGKGSTFFVSLPVAHV
ncbi:MAG: hypothetical protein CXR31_11255 [Geobacter sp.]|nr:MAG: hypothetical protein CXR31_11255 [Geobacter sp.]